MKMNLQRGVHSITVLISFIAFLAPLRGAADEQKPFNWGSPTNGIQLSVRLKGGSEVGTNQPVRLIMRFRNVSTNRFEVATKYFSFSAEVDNDYVYTVISPSGQAISPSKIHREEHVSSTQLHPGWVAETEYDLSTQYKFEELGEYKIVAKVMFHGTGPFYVVSNPLTVRVVSQSTNTLVSQKGITPFFHFILDPDEASDVPRVPAIIKDNGFEIVTDPTSGKHATITTNGIVTLNTKTGSEVWSTNTGARLGYNQVGSVYLIGDAITLVLTNTTGPIDGGVKRFRVNKDTGAFSVWAR